MIDKWSGSSTYESYVGRWSRQLAPRFLDWAHIDAPLGDALDVGCGTGALSAAVLARVPRSLVGIDLSEPFIAAASQRLGGSRVRFEVADAAKLPFPDASFDVVVSGLAVNFVPNPPDAAREMARVLRPGGVAAVYVWDYAGRMEMMRHFWDAAVEQDPGRAAALDEGARFPLCAPNALATLLRDAGLLDVATAAVDLEARFADFDDFWTPFTNGPGPAPGYCASLPPERREDLRRRVRARLPIAADGSITLTLRAWAARGVAAATSLRDRSGAAAPSRMV